MAGKSSLLRSLIDHTSPNRLTSETERTIGLDIKRLNLPDPRQRAVNGVELEAYDAGGHNEYQEMLGSFVTEATLYILLGPIAKALNASLREQMIRWAFSIQTGAPGSKILLLGSRADEADDPAQVQPRCEQLAACIREALQRQQAAQRAELANLLATGDAAAPRCEQLRRLLARPLIVPAVATAVSAQTLQGLDSVKQQLIEIAFDKSVFPHFGEVQPGTYGLIHRHLLRTHAEHPSLSWDELQVAAATEPPIDAERVHVRSTGSVVSQAEGAKAPHREFSFELSMQGEVLASFTLRFRAAQDLHKKLAAFAKDLPKFPAYTTDAMRDMVHDEGNVQRRATDLESYFHQLYGRPAVISHPAFAAQAGDWPLAGCDLEALRLRFLRSYEKVRRDPQLVRRAMLYLRLVGKVLCYGDGSAALEDRVWLQPQWLVNVRLPATSSHLYRHTPLQPHAAHTCPYIVSTRSALLAIVLTRCTWCNAGDARAGAPRPAAAARHRHGPGRRAPRARPALPAVGRARPSAGAVALAGAEAECDREAGADRLPAEPADAEWRADGGAALAAGALAAPNAPAAPVRAPFDFGLAS